MMLARPAFVTGLWAAASLGLLGALCEPMSVGRAFAADKELGAYLASACAACHQPSGRHQAGIPPIAGMPAESFVALMLAYQEKQRESAVMQAIAGRLDRQEIEALAAYYETLTPESSSETPSPTR